MKKIICLLTILCSYGALLGCVEEDAYSSDYYSSQTPSYDRQLTGYNRDYQSQTSSAYSSGSSGRGLSHSSSRGYSSDNSGGGLPANDGGYSSSQAQG